MSETEKARLDYGLDFEDFKFQSMIVYTSHTHQVKTGNCCEDILFTLNHKRKENIC